MKTTLRNHAAALALIAPLAATLVATPAAAQHRAVVAAPQVVSLALNSSAGLAPGAALRVQLYATPGARSATAALADSGVQLALHEQSPGNYVGRHVIRRGERIDPLGLVRVRLDYRGDVVARNFNFPPAFQALAMGAPAAAVHVPVIERFVVRGDGGRMQPGRELRFRLHGAPGAQAWVDIPGVVRGIALDERRPGVYAGSYTIRRRDDLRDFDNARATLQVGQQRVSARAGIGDRDDHRDRDRRG